MPFGGLDQYENMNTTSTVIDLGEIKLYEQPHHLFGDSLNLITAMIGVFIVMIPIRWIYFITPIQKLFTRLSRRACFCCHWL